MAKRNASGKKAAAPSVEPGRNKAAKGESAPMQAAPRPSGRDMPARPRHEEIAERAKVIWRAKGCPAGRDQETWYEAEAQLRRERGFA